MVKDSYFFLTFSLAKWEPRTLEFGPYFGAFLLKKRFTPVKGAFCPQFPLLFLEPVCYNESSFRAASSIGRATDS